MIGIVLTETNCYNTWMHLACEDSKDDAKSIEYDPSNKDPFTFFGFMCTSNCWF